MFGGRRVTTRPVRRPREQGSEVSDAKTRLLLAAEALFARSGIEGASLREIATRAGQGNHFAVQYHFGDRDGLVRALFDYRMLQMEPRRRKMLAAAKRSGRLADVRTLLEILLLPQLDLQDADGNNSYAGFLSQVLLRNSFSDFQLEFGAFGTDLPPTLRRAQHLLQERLNHLSQAAIRRRLLGACLMFLNMLVVHHGQTHEGESFDEALDDTLEQIVAGLCMPHLREAQSPAQDVPNEAVMVP